MLVQVVTQIINLLVGGPSCTLLCLGRNFEARHVGSCTCDRLQVDGQFSKVSRRLEHAGQIDEIDADRHARCPSLARVTHEGCKVMSARFF